MNIEKIIAKKDEGSFFNYTILVHSAKNDDNCDVTLLVSLIRTQVLQDVLDYEMGVIPYQYGSSDEWSVRYGDSKKLDKFYIEFYDFWAEQNATEVLDGSSGLLLNKLKSLKVVTRENLLELINSWQYIYQQKPNYVVITRTPSNWITLESSNELPRVP